jgi:hypothetical protein
LDVNTLFGRQYANAVKTPYISTDTINTLNYIKDCLEKRLPPLLREHNRKTLFWPDFTPVHYSKDTVSWYNANKVDFVEKFMNPPSGSQKPDSSHFAQKMMGRFKR